MAAEIVLQEVSKRYGDGATSVLAIHNVSFRIAAGEFCTILGPSGCGKSTVVHLIAGFIAASAGHVLVNDTPVRRSGADRVVVSQDYSLFWWKTVRANVEFGLKARGLPGAERKRLALRYLEMVELAEFAHQYPYALSGGMRQRLALARALVVEPECLLLDEPLAALDFGLRQALQDELLNLWGQTQQTILLVTHDLDEALYLSDRVLVMGARPGHIRATLAVPFARPRTPRVRMCVEYLKLKEQVAHHLSA